MFLKKEKTVVVRKCSGINSWMVGQREREAGVVVHVLERKGW